MITQVNSRHKQGALTMSNPPNYRPLTTHGSKAKPRSSGSVPKIGQRIAFDPDLVVQDTDVATQKLGTPMSKIRFIPAEQAWRQVPRHEAGMLVFFQNEPTAAHTAFVIQSIIPSQTACYAELV